MYSVIEGSTLTLNLLTRFKEIDILKEEGFNILVASMPEGNDPDEILKNSSDDYFYFTIGDVPSVIDKTKIKSINYMA